MADTLLYTQPYGAITLAPEVPCLVVSWHGFANSEQFRDLMDQGLALYRAEAQRTQPLGWLADTRSHSAIRTADQEWLTADWDLRAYLAGIRHVCFVVPTSVVGQITINTYSTNAVTSAEHPITTSLHRTLAEAKAELRATLQGQ